MSNPVHNTENWDVFGECTICRFWSPHAKLWKGRLYCTIHYPREEDKLTDRKMAKAMRESRTAFQKAKATVVSGTENA